MHRPTKTKQDTLRSERRSALRKALTEPTLLEMSGYPTYQELGRNRWVGQRERGPHESFSLVSPYGSLSKLHGEARTNLTRRISIETQRYVDHRVFAVGPLHHAAHGGRHRPRDGAGNAF